LRAVIGDLGGGWWSRSLRPGHPGFRSTHRFSYCIQSGPCRARGRGHGGSRTPGRSRQEESGLVRIELEQHVLHAELDGSGATTFLCLHGLVDSLGIWDRLADPLAQRGRVVRVDQRGHGASGAPPGPYRREDLAADAIAVLDHLGIERAVFVGHSMGGIVSMTAALAHPDRVEELVLIGTASQCSEKVAGWYERIARAGESAGTAGLARAIYGGKSSKAIAGDAAGIAHVTRTLKSLFDDPLTPRLGDVACPALLLVGEKDPMGPKASAIIAERMPDATLEVVPGCGHWIHVESPEVVTRALDRWRRARQARPLPRRRTAR